MQSYPELGRAITGIEDDLKFWKSAMTDLVGMFHELFPPTAAMTSGWTLYIGKCSKKKKCRMCPHSVRWRKFFYKRRKKETMARQDVKGGPNKFMWGRKREHIRDSFPDDLKLSLEIMEMFLEVEKMRLVIMKEHRQLSKSHNRLLALRREADKRREKNDLAPTANLEVSILGNLTDMVTSDRPAKREVLAGLWDMRVRFTKALIRRKAEREQLRSR